MRICYYAAVALLCGLIITDQAASQTSEYIYFETTGDFGLDSNWSDPAKAPPEKPPGATFDHNFYFYYINDNNTATISHDSPNGSHFEALHLFVGNSAAPPPPAPPVPHTPGTLIMEGGPAPAPGEFGASLTVNNIHEFRLGQFCNTGGLDPCTGGGTVIMNGASDLFVPGLIVGERARGELYIGPDARVRSLEDLGGGTLARRDIRIGTYGPERGLGVNTIDGNGFVEVAGELVGNTLYMPESDADGVLRVLPGGIVDLTGLNMTFEPNRPNRSSRLEIIGSGGSFTTTSGSVLTNHHTATIAFTADAAGVTPIVGGAGGDVEGGNLELDLDDFDFNSSSTMMLIDLQPDSLFGEFGNVTFMGNTTADLIYDYPNGDIFLNNFVSTDPPGVDGDYNDNGIVDAADYTVWRDHLGSTTVLPNDTTAGIVSAADYDVWKANFGMGSGAGLGAAGAVPEPATLAAILMLLACSAATRQFHRTKA